MVWRRPGAPSVAESRRFDPASGWEAGPVALSGTTNADAPDIGIGSRGDALALWQRPAGGQVTLQARRFVAPPVAPKPTPAVPEPVASVPDAPELTASPVASVPDAPEITRLRVRGVRVGLRLTAPAQLRAALERRTARGWRALQTRTLAAKAGDVRFGFDSAAHASPAATA